MKKYLFIFKSELMTNLQYIFNMSTKFISFFLFIFIFQSLWQYVYSDPSKLINGYSVNDMIWYVTITEILILSINSKAIVENICDDIKTGNIAYNINKPYDYIKYQVFNVLGGTILNLIIFIILGILTGYIFIGQIPNLSVVAVILFLLATLFSVIVNIIFLIAIGLVGFYIEDSTPFYWIYSKFIIVLGVVFPIEFFPEVVQKILYYSPIYAMTYGPATLFLEGSVLYGLNVILIQIIYIIIGYIICKLLYMKGVKKLSVNGG